MKVINLFAGPGAGKSTTAMALTVLLKNQGLNVEYVTEYAKDLTWEKRTDILCDQLYVLAKQNRKLARLSGQVQWAITDSPLLLSEHYRTPDYLPATFKRLVFELFESYDNINYVIDRVKPYNPVGRNQTEEEARKIDIGIFDMLQGAGIPFSRVQGNAEGVNAVISHLALTKQLVLK